jgi:hypothetical protein
VGGHVGGKVIAHNIPQDGLWWPTILKNGKDFSRECDVYQRFDRSSHRDDLPLHHVWDPQDFWKCEVDFIGPINPPYK